jgi:hypothetical protein
LETFLAWELCLRFVYQLVLVVVQAKQCSRPFAVLVIHRKYFFDQPPISFQLREAEQGRAAFVPLYQLVLMSA